MARIDQLGSDASTRRWLALEPWDAAVWQWAVFSIPLLLTVLADGATALVLFYPLLLIVFLPVALDKLAEVAAASEPAATAHSRAWRWVEYLCARFVAIGVLLPCLVIVAGRNPVGFHLTDIFPGSGIFLVMLLFSGVFPFIIVGRLYESFSRKAVSIARKNPQSWIAAAKTDRIVRAAAICVYLPLSHGVVWLISSGAVAILHG